MQKIISLCLFSLCLFSFSFAQTESDQTEKPSSLKIFLDCSWCDMNYFRQELNIVDYVRDRQTADVHVLVTANRTSSQRREFEVQMIGKKAYASMDLSLFRTTEVEPTSDDIRKTILSALKIGLVPYLSKTTLIDAVDVKIRKSRDQEDEPTNDPWNYWVFEVNANGSYSAETSRLRFRYSGNVSAERTTEAWRIRNGANFYMSSFKFSNSDGEDIETRVNRESAYSHIVKSLGDHLSAGTTLSYSRSSFSNIKLGTAVRAALEYNIFPYSEVSKREFTIAYRVGPVYREYDEITIYDKMDEWLWRESLSLALRMRQPWGNANISLEGGHYFHDISKHSLELDGYMNIRLFKGFNFRLSGSFELIRDQLSLPKGNASLEDILLQQRQIATGFESSVSVGFGYTFGSIYNNVVNTRL